MISAPKPENEKERLAELEEFGIIESTQDDALQGLAFLAKKITDSPYAMISLINENKQIVKARIGFDKDSYDRSTSICSYTILNPNEPFLVRNISEDERSQDSPYTNGKTSLAFYAGIPLKTKEKIAIGTLCVLDTKPHELDSNQLSALQAIADQVVYFLKMRRIALHARQKELETQLALHDMQQYSGVLTHDLRSPAAQMNSLMVLLKHHLGESADKQILEYIDLGKKVSGEMSKLIDGVLSYVKEGFDFSKKSGPIATEELMSDVKTLINVPEAVTINQSLNVERIHLPRTPIIQILVNLIKNAIDHNDLNGLSLFVSIEEEDDDYKIMVSDNGKGISKSNQKDIFDVYNTSSSNPYNTGIGLATVAMLVKKLKGKLELETEKAKGVAFTISIPKLSK